MAVRIVDIAEKVKLISAATSMADVVKQFLSDPECQCLTVVKNRKPAGVLGRVAAMEFAASSNDVVVKLLTAGEFCPAKVYRVAGEADMLELARAHQSDNYARLRNGAMVSNGRKYVGVLTLPNLLKAIASEPPETRSDTSGMALEPAPLPELPVQDAIPQAAANSVFETTQFVLGTLAHEIRTPLTGMLGLADLLASRIRDPEQRDIAETIARSGQTLDRILRDTLDYVSLENGKVDIQAETVDLSDLVTDVRQLWSAQAARRGLALHVGLDPDGPRRISVDLGRVTQIVNNLVSNALKFTQQGGVSVTVSTSAEDAELELRIDVADTGLGISGDDKVRLFEAFEKGNAPDHAPGWGLGLAISYALSRHLGGELSLTDNPGGGSVFSLKLPVKASEVIQLGAPKRRKSGQFELGEVLVIEDHEACAMVVTTALENAGWKVRLVSTLAEAEDILSFSMFQAVLTDLHLMDGSALSLIDRVRRLGGPNASVPILVMTADITEGTKQACLAIGADRALRKPIQGPALVATLADALMSRASGELSLPQLRGRIAS